MNRKRILIIFLLIATLAIAGVTAYIAYRSQEDTSTEDTSAATPPSCGYCANPGTGEGDCRSPTDGTARYDSCEQAAKDVCGGLCCCTGWNPGSGGGGDPCAGKTCGCGSLPACSGTQVCTNPAGGCAGKTPPGYHSDSGYCFKCTFIGGGDYSCARNFTDLSNCGGATHECSPGDRTCTGCSAPQGRLCQLDGYYGGCVNMDGCGATAYYENGHSCAYSSQCISGYCNHTVGQCQATGTVDPGDGDEGSCPNTSAYDKYSPGSFVGCGDVAGCATGDKAYCANCFVNSTCTGTEKIVTGSSCEKLAGCSSSSTTVQCFKCAEGSNTCTQYEYAGTTCPSPNNCDNCQPEQDNPVGCWATGCTTKGCTGGYSCVSDRCINTQCPTDHDCTCGQQTKIISLSGEVYCQDEGGSKYPIPAATLRIAATTNQSATLTTSTIGAFSKAFSETAASDTFSVTLLSLPSGNLSNGQPYSEMTFYDSNCDNPSVSGCNITGHEADSCSSPNGGYEYCKLTSGVSYSKFDFVFRNCSPVPVVCGDGLCNEVGENCERTAASATTYAACTTADITAGRAPTGAVVETCRGVENNAAVTTTSCKYCGDGILQTGEECEPSLDENCNSQCESVTPECIGLVKGNNSEVRIGEGNRMNFTLQYRSISTTNPFPNIALRVGNGMGRDSNHTNLTLVGPSTTPRFDSTTSIWTYDFIWEAADPTGTVVQAIAAGTYPVVVLTNSNDPTSVITTAACQSTITLSETAVEEPLFVIVKTANPICTNNGDVTIDYTIRLTNIGTVSGTLDYVRDNIDTRVAAYGLVPTNISPSSGTYSSGIIQWPSSTFAANETKVYTYRITIPSNLVPNFINQGTYNIASAQYDTTTTQDNTISFDVRTMIECIVPSVPVIVPDTGLGSTTIIYILLAGLFMTFGYLAYKYNIGNRQIKFVIKEAYLKTPIVSYEDKVSENIHKKRTRRK